MTGRKSKVVFISSPYAGDVKTNTDFARQACFYAICLGYTPIAPHLIYPGIIPDSDPAWRQVGLEMSCEQLALCDELWVCGPCATAGMQVEVDHAKDLGLWVRRVTCEEVAKGVAALEKVAIDARLKALQS